MAKVCVDVNVMCLKCWGLIETNCDCEIGIHKKCECPEPQAFVPIKPKPLMPPERIPMGVRVMLKLNRAYTEVELRAVGKVFLCAYFGVFVVKQDGREPQLQLLRNNEKGLWEVIDKPFSMFLVQDFVRALRRAVIDEEERDKKKEDRGQHA